MAFRALQPAPMEQEQPPVMPQGRPTLTQKPKRTVTLGACVACRKRKSKCDGSRPICTCCAQKDTDCIYELGPNEKPSQAIKRKNEEMQGELSNLRQLYDFLRLRPEQEAQEILRRIRANPPSTNPSQHIQQLADFARHGNPLNQTAYQPPSGPLSDEFTLPPLRQALDSCRADVNFSTSLPFPSGFMSMPGDGPSAQRRRHASDTDVSSRSDSHESLRPPTSIQAILQRPVSATVLEPTDHTLATAKNWTTVTDDEALISHLMSSWHSWEHVYHHWLDWETFVDDLTTGNTNFCSKLLVNSILASACVCAPFISQIYMRQLVHNLLTEMQSHSPSVRDRAKPFTNNLQTAFYGEACRLWELEEGRESLPRLQAALLIYTVLGKNGRDKAGHSFLVEACRIARALGLFRASSSPPIQVPIGVDQLKWERVRAVAAWSLFNFQVSMSFTYSFPTIIKSQPLLAIPYGDRAGSEALFRSECTRHVVMLDCANVLLNNDRVDTAVPPRPEQTEDLYLRFGAWWDSRPDSVNPAKDPSPQNLLAAMQYHVAIFRLVQPYLNRECSIDLVKAYHVRARTIASASMTQLRYLLRRQESLYGWSNAILYVLDVLAVVGFGSLEEVAAETSAHDPNSSESYAGLLTCLKGLSALSHFCFYAQPLFRLLTQSCQALGIRLPTEALSTMEYLCTEEWTKNAAHMVSSRYVADVRKTATEAENARMDYIIQQWDALTIGDNIKSGTNVTDGSSGSSLSTQEERK